MKRVVLGIVGVLVILCIVLAVVKFDLFGKEQTEAGNELAKSPVQTTEMPEVESVLASAANPTPQPDAGEEYPKEEKNSENLAVEEPAEVTFKPVESQTPSVPMVTATPEPEKTPEPTPAPTAASTEAPAPVTTATATPAPVPTAEATEVPTPQEENTSPVSDEDIAYIAELLEISEEEIREVIEKATEAGYNLDPDEILGGNFDIKEAWGIVTDVFGTKEAMELLLKVMKLGFF